MAKFLIEVPHPEDKLGCARSIQVFLKSASHYLTHADYGCEDGEHFAWMFVDAADREEAKRIVPPAFRAQARVVQLSRFSTDEIDETIRRHSD
jgi:hypothetical protein